MDKLKIDILLFISCILAGGLTLPLIFGADYYLNDLVDVQVHDTYFIINPFEFALLPISLALSIVFAVRVIITKFKNKLALVFFVLGIAGIVLSAIEIHELMKALNNNTFEVDE